MPPAQKKTECCGVHQKTFLVQGHQKSADFEEMEKNVLLTFRRLRIVLPMGFSGIFKWSEWSDGNGRENSVDDRAFPILRET